MKDYDLRTLLFKEITKAVIEELKKIPKAKVLSRNTMLRWLK